MSDWVGTLLIGVLFVAVVVLGVALFFLWQEQQHTQDSARKEHPVVMLPPVNHPVEKPRITLRRQQPVSQKMFRRRPVTETTVRRKILGNKQTTTAIPATPIWVVTPTEQPKIKTREVKIDFNEIHKVTGIPIKDCPCPDCQEMRANVGS